MWGLADVEQSPWRLLDGIVGSRAYGTDHADSDLDIRGVYVAPPEVFYGFDPPSQVSDEKHDVTYYELGRFVELLAKNNPNVLEMLFLPDACVRHVDPLFARITPEMVLSKQCRETFAGYAMGQIRKARGLNKKIVNPMPEQRLHPLAFCHVLDGQGSVNLSEWLNARGWDQCQCGAVKVPHLREVYALFHDPNGIYRGLFHDGDEASDLRCSSVAKEAVPVAWIGFNQDAFQRHCREHHDYWVWVKERNESRYQTNVEHGRQYDSKNLMHTFRLLDMAEEIARDGRPQVRRPNAAHLKRIRSGEFAYDDLVAEAEAKVVAIDALYEVSGLPDSPNKSALGQVMIEIREAMYRRI